MTVSYLLLVQIPDMRLGGQDASRFNSRFYVQAVAADAETTGQRIC
jgi:hypothetical protein